MSQSQCEFVYFRAAFSSLRGEWSTTCNYLQALARRYDLNIYYRRKVVSATWNEVESTWYLEVLRSDSSGDAIESMRARAIISGTGYYSKEAPHAPVFPSQERFAGRVLHAQNWPRDQKGRENIRGKVVVVGSGATAITLAPELATETPGSDDRRVDHVTIVQRRYA